MDHAKELPTARLELELLVGVTPISGTIRVPGSAGHRFQGWLELVAAIDRASNANLLVTRSPDDPTG